MIKVLEDRIKVAAQSYYENGKAIMTDYDFDKLVDSLKAIDPNNKLLTTPGFGYDTSKVGRKEVYHEDKLYSINLKIKDYEEFKSYFNNLKDQGYLLQMIQPKFDGISATGYWKNGKLTKLVTRGDGVKGFDIKNNVNLDGMDGLIKNGSARFEICMSWENWKKYYNIEENPSPRNLVAGICSKLNPEPWEKEIAHPILLDGTVLEKKFIRTPKLLMIEDVKDELPKCDYPTDGYVIKYVDVNGTLQVYAFKPQNEMRETEIVDITWQEGNTGKLTPVLSIKPINLSGAAISRVTGNSMSMMENLGTGIGAKVKVFRSGEVIPCIGEVLERSEDFNLPDYDFRKGAHIYRDISINLAKKFIYMLQDLKHFGGSLSDKIINQEEISTYSDVVSFICKSTGNQLEGYTEHELDLISKALNMVKNYSYQDLIAGLNIPNIGYSAIDKIIKGEKLPVHSQESWGKVKDNLETFMIDYLGLINFYFPIKVEEKRETKGKVVITGKHAMKRSEMESKLRDKGYEIQDGVNKDTDYLIIADINSNSSKAKKARELGTKLISSIEELI